MSTYLNALKPKQHGDYSDCPKTVIDFLNYSETIRNLSPRTVNAYYIDLRTFFKFLKLYRKLVPEDIVLNSIEIKDIDLTFIKLISTSEIYEFLYYVTRERENAAATRARKLSSLKGYFLYLNKQGLLFTNPVDDVESPSIKKRLPKYLSLDESKALLNNIQTDFYERDYCIITLFLNCGLRLTELTSINITDIQTDTMRVVGKGDKERVIYLNEACLRSLNDLILERSKLPKLVDSKALFVSKRTGKRLSVRRVQQIVDGCFKSAGLDGKGYSVHKLRHTAATLLYQYGNVDLLALKEILGHEELSTTQIYTHLDTAQLKEAAAASPLAGMKMEKPMVQVENSEISTSDVDNSVESVENSESKDKNNLL